jgi:23S rRNA (uracil1939-C5)-methyltransferase
MSRKPSVDFQKHKDCPACPLASYGYKEQLNFKRELVMNSFLEEGFDPAVINKVLKPTKPSPLAVGYRNKAKWVLRTDERGKIQMGVYKPGTHDLADIRDCLAHAPQINEVSQQVLSLLTQNKVHCEPDDLTKPALRYLIVRYSFFQKSFVLVFVSNQKEVPGLAEVFAGLQKLEVFKSIKAIVQNINNDRTNVLLGEANRFISRSGELVEKLGAFKVPVGPLSFLQVNTSQATHLYKRVERLLEPSGVAYGTGLDLYGGIGLMAMHAAQFTETVLSVEDMGSAALEGMTAARRNKISNVLYFCGDALEGLKTFHSEWGVPDWVIVNPPRRGCDEEVLREIAKKMPAKLVYVSCNPRTLARDVLHLLECAPGLRLRTLEPFDMFPQTAHVETIALLENTWFRSQSVESEFVKEAKPSSKRKKRSTKVLN